MAGHFRSSTWDPILIFFQILTVQCIFYMGLGVCIILIDCLTASHYSLDQLFSYKILNIREMQGNLLISANVLNAIIGSISLWYIVQRTKQCWDFAITAYLLHFLLSWIINGRPPTSATWWLVNVLCAIIMTVVGEYLCMRSELDVIPINSSTNPKVDL